MFGSSAQNSHGVVLLVARPKAVALAIAAPHIVTALFRVPAGIGVRHAGTKRLVEFLASNKEHVPLEQGDDGKVLTTSSPHFIHHSHSPSIIFAASSPKRA